LNRGKCSALLDHDALIIGAGFFGLEVALELGRIGFRRILVVEREPAIMRRASYVNQARVHNGYHYPRSMETAERSRVNFERFVADYADAVDQTMESVYAVAHGSRVSSAQFELVCRAIKAPCRPAPLRLADLFDPGLIESVFLTRELAFNSVRLARRLEAAIDQAGIAVVLGVTATVLQDEPNAVTVDLDGTVHRAAYVFNCTYADIEGVGVTLRSRIKKELAEIVLIAPPRELHGLGVTVVDGPFFSTMPFPAAGLHSLSHVRYTPHEYSSEPQPSTLRPHRSNRLPMLRDSERYLPCLGRSEVVGSMFEMKATLVRNEDDDGRPILVERAVGMPRVLSMLGAKIDNIYDVQHFLQTEHWDVAG